MATCNNVTEVQQSEFLAESLYKINTNFSNLDLGLCELGKELSALNDFVKSLTVRDTSTVDMTFNLNGYYVQGEVKNSSLGTSKLGVDIPNTTKQFLTAAELPSLIDVNIANVKNENALRWKSAESKWINTSLADEVGARRLDELNDVTVLNSTANGYVVRYDSAEQKWISDPEFGQYLPDGTYEDIQVSNGGKKWEIRQGKVGERELATNAVTTDKIADKAVTGSKIANSTIGTSKINFTRGEVNTGKNVGTGSGLFAGKSGARLNFKSIKATGNCTIQLSEDESEIILGSDSLVASPNRPNPSGANVGFGGTNVFKQVLIQGNEATYQFKKINSSGSEITITEDDENITISKIYKDLSFTIFKPQGVSVNIGNELTKVFPSAPAGTVCKVIIEEFSVEPVEKNIEFTIPWNNHYFYKVTTTCWSGNIIGPGACSSKFELSFKGVLAEEIPSGIPQDKWARYILGEYPPTLPSTSYAALGTTSLGTNNFKAVTNVTGTVNYPGVFPVFNVVKTSPNKEIKTYTAVGGNNNWVES